VATTTTTAADWGAARGLRRPGGRRRSALIAALAVAVALVELTLAVAVSHPALTKLAALAIAVFALAFVFRFPLAAAAGLLLVTASIFYSSYFTWSVGPIQLHLEELVFASLALVAVAAPRRQTWGGAAGGALAIFLAAVVLSAWLGVQAGRTTVRDAFDWARPLVFYGTFWVVLRLFPDARSLRRLLIAGLACGALTGVIAVVLQVAPSLGHRFQGSGGQEIYTQATQSGLGGLKRIRLPGLALSYLLFWWSLLAAMSGIGGRRRALLWALAGLGAVDIALSFNRNMWIGLILGLGVVLVLAGARIRHRLLTGLALGLLAVVLTFTVVGGSNSSARLDPIIARAATVLTPQQVGEESSLRDRARETAQALDVVEEHPLTGVGAGADFGVRFNHEDRTGIWVNKIQLFLHDQWIWLMLIGVVPALLAFLAFLGIVLSKAWSRRTRTLTQVALGAGLVMVMLSAFVMPYLGLHEFGLAIGLVAAVIVRVNELERERRAGLGGRP
jgi:O-antigen ligase